MSKDVEVRGVLLELSDTSVSIGTEDGVSVWLPRDQVAIVYDVGRVVVTMPEKLAIAKGIY